MARARAAPSCGSVPAPSSSRMTSERLSAFFKDAHDIGQMPAEGAERLFNGLLIADISPDCLEAGQLGAALRRDVQPRLRHQHQQPDRLQADGLAAGVRAGDDQRADAGVKVNIDGDDGGRVEQGVASLEEKAD
jgi:hypothetical protein